jgi:hypothetical protein
MPKLTLYLKNQLDSTPSVFSLDLPTKGNTQRESHKRELNLKLINLMITKIPNESKFCKLWPKDVIGLFQQPQHKEQLGRRQRLYCACLTVPDLDLDLHKKDILEFVQSM